MLPFLRIFVNNLVLSSASTVTLHLLSVCLWDHLPCSVLQPVPIWELCSGQILYRLHFPVPISLCTWIQMITNCFQKHSKQCIQRITSKQAWPAKYQGGMFLFTLLERKLVQSLSAGLYNQQESWLHGQKVMGKLIPLKQSGLALLNYSLLTALRLERSTRNICSLVLSGVLKTHRGHFTAGLLRYGDGELSIEQDLPSRPYSDVTASLHLHPLK